MARRTFSINEEAYKQISKFCKENTLVMNAWVEKIILEKIEQLKK
jgi:hypothetical protein